MAAVLAFLVAYLIGTFPTAYLLVRAVQHIDLRRAGSTNIGALNAYEVTGRRWIGITVAVVDMLKGILAVLAAEQVMGLLGGRILDPFWPRALGLLGVVAGHNYNLWLSIGARKLSGGKGLAAAAGGMLLIMPLMIPVWVVMHYLGRWLFRRWKGVDDVIPGNVFATLLFPLLAGWIYGTSYALVGLGLALLVLPKHVHQMRALLSGHAYPASQES